MRSDMTIAILLIFAWIAFCAYVLDYHSPEYICGSDTECMILNGGDGSPFIDISIKWRTI